MDDVIKRAQDRLKADQSSWHKVYNKAKEDLRFLSDDEFAQWDSKDAQDRISTGRPVLSVDYLSQFIHQVSNDIRMNTPSINVLPGSGASVETADIFKGLIRNIEYRSNADDVYDMASLFSVKCSLGFMRVDHDYESSEGFNQELIIQRVINPFTIWIDSDSIECDGRDMMHANVLEKIKVSTFKRKYPGKAVESFDTDENSARERKSEDYITISEYFEIVEENKVVALDNMGNEIDNYQDGTPASKTRGVKKRTVKRYRLSGSDILEETTFPGEYIPIVPVYGEEAWNEGERNLFSLTRRSKQAQQMYNLWKSLETELLQKQPQAPVMAAAGSIEDYAADWKNPSKSMALRYNTLDSMGNPLPQPTRLDPPTIPTGIVNASREAVEDIKATMGMYNASLGQRGNETSGKAIMARQQEGDVATFHFADNLNRSITQVGRILVCAIPEIYDTPRIIRIIGSEDEPKEVGINGERVEDQEISYDLRKGKYDVKVTTGASYSTKRQEAAQFFTDVVTRQPELMQVAGDLLFKNMDFPGAEALSNRMKKLVDPKLLEGEDGEEKQQEVMPDLEKIQMQQIIEQGAQQMQAMQQELENMKQQLGNKQLDAQLKYADNEVKIQSEQMKAETERMKLELEAEKLLIEKEKIALDKQRMQVDLLMSQAQPVSAPEIEYESNMIDLSRSTPEIVQAHFQAMAEKKAQEEQEQAQKAQAEFDKAMREEQERIDEANRAAMLLNGLAGIQDSLQSLTAEIKKPKQVVRNENGLIAGIE